MTFVLFYNNKYIKKKKNLSSSKKIRKQKAVCVKINFNYQEDNLLYLNILLGSMTKHGKKSKAYKILSNFLFLLKKKNLNSYFALFYCLNKIRPHILLFNKKRGTSVFELPRLLSLNQEKCSAIKWLVDAALRSKKNMSQSLADETNKILLNQGEILKKKERIIKTSFENRPFFYLLRR